MRPYLIPAWKQAPFLRLLLPWTAGIVWQWYADPPAMLLWTAACLLGCCLIFVYALPVAMRYQFRYLQGGLILLSCVLLASLVTRRQNLRLSSNWYGHASAPNTRLLIRITEEPLRKSNSIRWEAAVQYLIRDTTLIPTTGKLWLYAQPGTAADSVQYGQLLVINPVLQPIRSGGNPASFNYQRYAAFQQVYHTAYVKATDYQVLPVTERPWLEAFIHDSRERILASLQTGLASFPDALGIAEALLIGYKADLDRDVVQAYSNAGVVHVIAISGLHLGLIYWILQFLFERMPFLRKKKWLRIGLVLLGIWLFSLLTGASASVVRSAVMLTCMLIGSGIRRPVSIYHSITASAFLLLLYNPYWLWDVGFQLSYLAVGGIVLLQKPIENLWYVRQPWLKKIWSLSCVTLAAQLATTPLCLYYFHQFPTLFFISNLLIVPLSTIILGAELLLLITAWQPQLLQAFGWLAGWGIRLMNHCIEWFTSWTFSLIDGLYFDGWMLLFAYAVLVSMGCCWLLQQRRGLWLAMCSAVGWLVVWNVQSIGHARQSFAVLYQVPKRLAIDFIQGNQYCFVGDNSWQSAAYLENFHLKPNRTAWQLEQRTAKLTPEDCRHQILHWNQQRWLIADSLSRPPAQETPVDYLVFTNKTKQSLEEWTKTVRTKLLIIDASNSMWKIEQWKTAAGKLHLPCFSVPEQGALVSLAPE